MSDKPIVINKNMLFEGFSPNITPKNKIENVTLTVKNSWYDSPEEYVTPDEEKVKYRFYQHAHSDPSTPETNYLRVFEILSGMGDDIDKTYGTHTTKDNIQVKTVVNPDAPSIPVQEGEIIETTSYLINKIKFTLKIPEYAKLPYKEWNVSEDFYLVANFDRVFFVYETSPASVRTRKVDNVTQEIQTNNDLEDFKHDYLWEDSDSYSFVVGNVGGVGDALPRFGVDKVEFDYENMLATFYVYCLASIETSRVAGADFQYTYLRAILDATFSLRCKYYVVENETQTITYSKAENIGTTYDITNPLFDFASSYLQPDLTRVLLHKEVADNILNSYEKGRSYGSLTTCYGRFYYSDDSLALSGDDGKIIEPLDRFKIGDITGFYNDCVVTKSEFDLINNKLYIDYIVADYEPQVFNETTLTFAPNTPAGTISLNIIAFNDATKVFNFDGTKKNITSSSSITVTHTYSSIGQKNILISIPANDGTYTMGFAHYQPFITSTHSSYLKELIIGKNVPFIDEWSFSNCSSLEKVIISDGVTSIREAAFLNCPLLQVVELHCATPPTLYNENVFGNKDNVIIKVPKHLINEYKSASGWSYFANRIQAL